MKVFVGLDTSCYTTSVALLSESGVLLQDQRRILKVKPGGCGLMQSEMVFQHTRALPELIEQAWQQDYEVTAIGVSSRPRPQEDSYMPAFLVGLGAARSLARVLNVPLYQGSHQENHLLAGLWSGGWEPEEVFLMLHISGGTTDLLLVKKSGAGYSLQQVGGSLDLHAGQFIDRVGVALNLQFPTGPALEKIAEAAVGAVELPVSVRGCNCSLSGPATDALRKLEAGAEGREVARATEVCLGTTFGRMLRNAAKIHEVKQALIVGGVAANQCIRSFCGEILAKSGVAVHWARPEYSNDGAVGNAYYALRCYKGVNQEERDNGLQGEV